MAACDAIKLIMLNKHTATRRGLTVLRCCRNTTLQRLQPAGSRHADATGLAGT